MRRYDKGEIVGESDPPGSFEEWLRRQRENWDRLDTSDPYVVGRRQMLNEVQTAWEQAKHEAVP